MLNWLKPFNIFCLLDTQGYHSPVPDFECMLAIGGTNHIELEAPTAFAALRSYHEENPGWLFGHLSYDLKNADPLLHSSHPDKIGFPDGLFFRPEILIIIKDHSAIIHAADPESVFKSIAETTPERLAITYRWPIQQRISKSEYLQSLKKIQAHIQRGDCYEINFCQEFFMEDVDADPAEVYKQLTDISPNPFSALYRYNNTYCICASPERFLQKKKQRLLSQPIKGTALRSNDPKKDEENLHQLQQSEKDKSENVMIVDLVRNDFSKVCERNTVKATSLFEVKAYPQVYQMISTIEGELKDIHWTEALRATFPMGSMTGAPKFRVMQLIEDYESSKRGLYSGAIGYVTPEGDFDFNVVIRSVLYNAENKYLSFWAGGGITTKSDPEKEYAECLMKTMAIRQIFQ